MNLAPRVQFFRDAVLTRRSFQITAFILILALSFGLFFLARPHLDSEKFVLYGYLGVFVINLICAATIVFPIPGEAVIIAAGTTLNPLWLGIISSVAITLGELTSYGAGYLGRKVILGKYVEKYGKAEAWLKRYGSLAVFLFALFPFLIFDLLGLVAGAFRFPLWKFILACWAGRLIRCLIEAYLGWGAFGFLPQL